MLFENITYIDENFQSISNGYVGIKDGKIAYLSTEPPKDISQYGRIYNGSGKLLMPALYNAHAHSPMTLLRGYGENMTLHDWLNNRIWPYEAHMNDEDNYWGCMLSLAEMARFGCVSMSDMYFHSLKRAQAVHEAGLKANIAPTPLCFEEKPFDQYTDTYHQYLDEISSFQGFDNDDVRYEMCIHAEYTNNSLSAKGIVELASKYNLSLHVHASETKSEVEDCKERHSGMTPIQWLESIGAMELHPTIAHCVWLEDADFDILEKYDCTVAYNPLSNMKLASGFAPIPKLLERGIDVALGTDGMASNNNNNMFQDMNVAGLLSKGYLGDPRVITPTEIIKMATIKGAEAQGRNKCGLIKEGYDADLCVLDIEGVSWCPTHDLLTNVIYAGSGSDVVLTMCNGGIVYEEGTWPTIDVEKVKAEVEQRNQRILCELEKDK